MNIYTHYSDSHKDLFYDYFLPSLRMFHSEEELPLRRAVHKQTTASGSFMEEGWNDAMMYKLLTILQGIEESWGDYFIFSDVDIMFYDRFVEDLVDEIEKQDVDILCQNDRGSLCAGFFIARANDEMKKLFTTIKNTFHTLVNDQVALNEYKSTFKYALLDGRKYFTIGNFFTNTQGTNIWDNFTNITPPREMKMHHGNYTIGVESKRNLLKMIKSNYEDILRQESA